MEQNYFILTFKTRSEGLITTHLSKDEALERIREEMSEIYGDTFEILDFHEASEHEKAMYMSHNPYADQGVLDFADYERPDDPKKKLN